MADDGKTIGDFRFGLDSQVLQNEFLSSLYRELEPLKDWGEVPQGVTFFDIAGAILDTLSGYTQIADIPATELPDLIGDILEQLRDEE